MRLVPSTTHLKSQHQNKVTFGCSGTPGGNSDKAPWISSRSQWERLLQKRCWSLEKFPITWDLTFKYKNPETKKVLASQKRVRKSSTVGSNGTELSGDVLSKRSVGMLKMSEVKRQKKPPTAAFNRRDAQIWDDTGQLELMESRMGKLTGKRSTRDSEKHKIRNVNQHLKL